MGDVIKFKKPKPVKPPRKLSPAAKKIAATICILAFFVVAWAYFQFIAV